MINSCMNVNSNFMEDAFLCSKFSSILSLKSSNFHCISLVEVVEVLRHSSTFKTVLVTPNPYSLTNLGFSNSRTVAQASTY